MSHEQQIARARLAGLIRAIAAAENRAAVAVARGKDAAPHEREAAALRAELARVSALAEGCPAAPPVAPEQQPPQDEDGEVAAEAAVQRLAPRDHLALVREMRCERAVEPQQDLRWPGRPPPLRPRGARGGCGAAAGGCSAPHETLGPRERVRHRGPSGG